MSTDNILLILEMVVIGVLIGVNIWIIVKKKRSSNRKSIEGAQMREHELNQMLSNQAGAGLDSARLRPYEEHYSSESRETTMVGGLRVELKVVTPVSEKKYLTTITEKLAIGADTTNELILDSKQVAGKEAILIREKGNLLFQTLNPAGETYVERSRTKRLLSDKPFRVHTQDRFHMQDVVMEIRLV